MGFLLYFVAIFLFAYLYLILFPLSAALDLRGTAQRLGDSALVIDVLANVLFGPFWNLLLIKRSATQRFGKLWETLSEIVGHAKQEGTLTIPGKLLAYLLHRIDPFHCEWAVGLRPAKPLRNGWQIVLAVLEVSLILTAVLSLPIVPFWVAFSII